MVASDVVTKFPANDWLEASGKTMDVLAQETGLNIKTVRLAFIGGTHKLKVSSAGLISTALEVPLEEIIWAVELTDQGREPLTGGTYTTGRENHKACCPTHFIELPATGKCDECAA